jgi:colicin import membrane protein
MPLEAPTATARVDLDRLAAIAAMTAPTRRVPPPPGGWQSWSLSLAAHGALIAALFFSVRWQSAHVEAIEAELWSPAPQLAAPPAPPPPPPVAAQAPRPEPKIDEAAVQAEIALRKARELEERKRSERERLERERRDRETAQKLEREKQAKAKADAAAAEQRQLDNMRRLQAQATQPLGAGSSNATSSPRGDPTFNAKVVACVRPNVSFPIGLVRGNAPSEFLVERLPDGSIGKVTVRRSGGNTAFDEAVVRGIRACNPFPQPPGGAREFTISYRPEDAGG